MFLRDSSHKVGSYSMSQICHTVIEDNGSGSDPNLSIILIMLSNLLGEEAGVDLALCVILEDRIVRNKLLM